MGSVRKKLNKLMLEIQSDYMHGECFYDYDMLNDFIENLDKARKLAIQRYSENKKEC